MKHDLRWVQTDIEDAMNDLAEYYWGLNYKKNITVIVSTKQINDLTRTFQTLKFGKKTNKVVFYETDFIPLIVEEKNE